MKILKSAYTNLVWTEGTFSEIKLVTFKGIKTQPIHVK